MKKRLGSGSRDETMAKERLVGRRSLLRGGLAAAGLAGAVLESARADESVGDNAPPWMKKPGRTFSTYGVPAKSQESVQRTLGAPPGRPGTGVTQTPLQLLEGTITPSGLHFERHHNGVPDIDPAQHQLVIHGMVKRPLAFSVDALKRYPMETHIHFIECSGNSGGYSGPQARQATAGVLNGLISCSEWTGVRLSTLLGEAELASGARWLVAEGADAAAMSRSVPLEKCQDDALVALFQNGEAIRPEQGFPMRLLLPGWEGNMHVKWLRRLKVTDAPVNARDETSHYTELMPDGKARQYMFLQAVKSIILKPSFGLNLQGPGTYEISGLAWSGSGRIAKVEVSTDGGRTWTAAPLSEPVLSKALTRFRLPWNWDGRPATLMSRATDETGDVQPTRAAWLAQYATGQFYHYNGTCAWSVEADGMVKNVYA